MDPSGVRMSWLTRQGTRLRGRGGERSLPDHAQLALELAALDGLLDGAAQGSWPELALDQVVLRALVDEETAGLRVVERAGTTMGRSG